MFIASAPGVGIFISVKLKSNVPSCNEKKTRWAREFYFCKTKKIVFVAN